MHCCPCCSQQQKEWGTKLSLHQQPHLQPQSVFPHNIKESKMDLIQPQTQFRLYLRLRHRDYRLAQEAAVPRDEELDEEDVIHKDLFVITVTSVVIFGGTARFERRINGSGRKFRP